MGNKTTIQTYIDWFENNTDKYKFYSVDDGVEIGFKTYITIIDNEGYLYTQQFKTLRKTISNGGKLGRFFNKNRNTLHNIYNFSKHKGFEWEILSLPNRNDEIIKLKCLKHNTYMERKWTNLQKTNHCCSVSTAESLKKSQRHDIDYIKNTVESFDFKFGKLMLLSRSYINSETPLDFVDSDGFLYFTDYNNVRTCMRNDRNLSRYDKNKYWRDNIQNYLDINEIDLRISDDCEYVKTSDLNLKFICPRCGIVNTSLRYITRFNRCPDCNKKRDLNIDIVYKEFLQEGYLVDLEKTNFDGNRSTIYFDCPKHKNQSLIYGNFQQGARCTACGHDRISGENNWQWNPDKTDEERKIQRKYKGYLEWRKEVYKRDNYTCQRCGSTKSNYLNAHHKDGYHWCKDRRTDVSNGVALCEYCHDEFHTEYGKKNNTEQQYLEWINKN